MSEEYGIIGGRFGRGRFGSVRPLVEREQKLYPGKKYVVKIGKGRPHDTENRLTRTRPPVKPLVGGVMQVMTSREHLERSVRRRRR